MGSFQTGFEVDCPTQDPDKPDEEPIPPPLFHRPTVSFRPNNGSNNEMSNMNGASVSICAGPLSFQVAASFSSDRVVIHQLLSCFVFGITAVTIGFFLGGPLINSPRTGDTALFTVLFMMIIAFSVVALARPEYDKRGAARAAAPGAAPRAAAAAAAAKSF